MRSRGVLHLLALASLAVVANAGCKPTYTCDPPGAGSAPSICHATYSCVFNSPCLPSATCTQSFEIGDGVDSTSKLPFNYSTASGSVTGGMLGGQSYCGPAGCDDNSITITFQSTDLSQKWQSATCESKDTAEQCRLSTKIPIPNQKPLTKITAQQQCLNQFTPCTWFKATATIDFYAVVAWPEPPMPLPSPPSPQLLPPQPPLPPSPQPTPSAFAKGGSGRKAFGVGLLVFYVLIMSYAVVGYLFVRQRARRSNAEWPSWASVFVPFRCDEEIGAGTVSGMRRECELLWCWFVRPYWRHSEREAMDAYWAYHPMDGED